MDIQIDTRTMYDVREAVREMRDYAARTMAPRPLDSDDFDKWADDYATGHEYECREWADKVGIRAVEAIVEAIVEEQGGVYTLPYETRLGGLVAAACYWYHYEAAQAAIRDIINP